VVFAADYVRERFEAVAGPVVGEAVVARRAFISKHRAKMSFGDCVPRGVRGSVSGKIPWTPSGFAPHGSGMRRLPGSSASSAPTPATR
jgi:hypothetical protein